jgi:hypothetical protein
VLEEGIDGEMRPSTGTTELSVDLREFGAMGSKRTTTHMASMSTMDASQRGGGVRHHGSFSKLSSVFRNDRGTMSTIKGKGIAGNMYEPSTVTDRSRLSLDHVHDDDDEDEDGVENVRACCGGMI